MTDRELMQMALDALVQARKLRFALWRNGCDCEGEHTCDPLKDSYAKQFNDAIIAIEDARLAQPEPEPVAWCIVENGRVHGLVKSRPAVMNAEKWQPLYTAPPQREWQGLTDEEIRNEAKNHVFDESFFSGAVWARGKIMGKNHG